MNDYMNIGDQLRKYLPKLVWLILAGVLVWQIIKAVQAFRQPAPKLPKVQSMEGGKIALAVDRGDFKVGEQIPVTVRVSTGGHTTDGTDLVFRFDPAILETSESAVTKGLTYPEYPLVKVDSASGLVRISGITNSKQNGFNGIGVFATVNFKAKKSGKIKLSVESQPNMTSDSNVVETGTSKDILDKVFNLDLTIL